MKYIDATHNMSSLTVEFIAEDGTRYLRTGGTPCWRFFNPGNIRPSKTSVCNNLKISTGKTKSGKFMIFPDYETGWRALKLLLTITYKNFTINQLASIYSPEEDGNDPEKYTGFIVNKANVNAGDYIRDMDDLTLEQVMEAIKQMEGYYNKKDTQRETFIPTTNITITDGNKPLANQMVKVIIDQCTYEWFTNKYGVLPPIAHLPGRQKIDIIPMESDGNDNVIYSAIAGTASQNVILMKSFRSFSAKTGQHQQSKKITEVYTVKKGDTLSKIAKRLRTTVKRIAVLNGITDVNAISIGQELKLPGGASKPQELKVSQSNQQMVPTGVSDQGYPQVNVGERVEAAPWMKIALEQARVWAGKTEGGITVNYHKEVGVSLSSIEGDSNPWCASFVNYCLISSRPAYRKSNTPARARSFAQDSSNFRRIDKPVYGAIAVFRRNGGGHACFVYASSKNHENNIIVLGGNQSDCINFVDRSERNLVGYYLPAVYSGEMDASELEMCDAEELNASLNIYSTNDGSEI